MIVIFAPYGRNEVTAAAIRLADLIVSMGEEVRLVALGAHENCIHPFWDQRVRSSKGNSLYKTGLQATHCIWFTVNEIALEMIRLVVKAYHVLVPSWHGLQINHIKALSQYDSLVCPSKSCCTAIKKRVFDNMPPAKEHHLTWACWNEGLVATRHSGLVDERPRLLMHCDASVIDECGALTINIAQHLLNLLPDIRMTLLCTKTWCRRDRSRLLGLARCFSSRCQVLYQRSLIEQAALFEQHDWLLLPGVKSDFGLTAMRGLACGLPVIAYDVSPVADHIRANYSGLLVPCETTFNWLGAPIAVPSSAAFATVCVEALADPKRLQHLQSNNWRVPSLASAFNTFWTSCLDLAGTA